MLILACGYVQSELAVDDIVASFEQDGKDKMQASASKKGKKGKSPRKVKKGGLGCCGR